MAPSVTFFGDANLNAMLKPRYKFLSLVCVLAILGSTQGATVSAGSTPILVELFTSEGCSDCPPADTFLRTLDTTQPVAGAELIVLEEHVDYWDDGGWRDPFSSHAFTLRQSDYVNHMHLASAYTPQMVVDGVYQFVGSDRRRAAKAFEDARSTQKIVVRMTSPRLENERVLIHVDSDAVPTRTDVFVALAADRAETQVLGGENGGRHLQHVAVAKSLAKVGKAEKGEAFSKDISVSAKSLAQPIRVIVFLQEPNQGRILGGTIQIVKN